MAEGLEPRLKTWHRDFRAHQLDFKRIVSELNYENTIELVRLLQRNRINRVCVCVCVCVCESI